MIKRICGDDLEIISLIDEVTVGGPGGLNNPLGLGGKSDKTTSIVITDIISNDSERKEQHGTSQQYAIRRLRRQRPDLHAKVLADELSPHAAMICSLILKAKRIFCTHVAPRLPPRSSPVPPC